MANRKLLSLDDLYNFYMNQNKTCTFSSKETGDKIYIQIEEDLEFSDDYDAKSGLLPVHLQSCHIGQNRNQSCVTEKAMKKAMKSFKNRPILGYIHELHDENGNRTGEYAFAGHEMFINNDGELEYLESPVGVIPESCNAQLVYDTEKDKTYLEVDGYIFEDYTRAAEILRKEGQCKVSVEIACSELSYDSENKVLNIDEFTFQGVTILGKTVGQYASEENTVEEGMYGSNVTIADFSLENNSLASDEIVGHSNYESKLIETLEKLNTTLSSFKYTNDARKEENSMQKNEVFEEEVTLQNEEVTEETTVEEEVTVAEEMSEETAEGTPEVVETESVEEAVEETVVTESVEEIEETEVVVEESVEAEETTETEVVEEMEETVEGQTDEFDIKYSVESCGKVKEFSVSLNEKINAITTLVNDTYGEQDGAWYGCEIYDDDNYVIMVDYWNGRAFKQSYKVKKNVYSLTGDRVPVKAIYVTEDEEAKLDEIRSNYSLVVEELNGYKNAELHSAREAILCSEEYTMLDGVEEFETLKKEMDRFSLEELSQKADLIFAKVAKANFAASKNVEEVKPAKKNVFMATLTEAEDEMKANQPYGGLFANYKAK